MHKSVTWICHVDDFHKPEQMQCDVIIGMDLMTEIGIFVNTATKRVQWEDSSCPLKERGTTQDRACMEALYHMAVSPPVLQTAEARQKRILDANCSAVDV